MAYGEETILISRRVLEDLNTAAKMLPRLVLLDDKKEVNRILEIFDHYLSESKDPHVKVLDYITQSNYDSFDSFEITKEGERSYFEALKALYSQGVIMGESKKL